MTLTGSVVVDQAVQNAVVCMDLNANSVCDTGEPVSAKTGYGLDLLKRAMTEEL